MKQKASIQQRSTTKGKVVSLGKKTNKMDNHWQNESEKREYINYQYYEEKGML